LAATTVTHSSQGNFVEKETGKILKYSSQREPKKYPAVTFLENVS